MRSLLLIICVLAGCGSDPTGSDDASASRDLGSGDDLTGADLAGLDLTGADLTTAPADMATYPNPIIGTGAPTEVQGNFAFLEGPLWRAAEGVLLFTDPSADKVYKLTPPSTIVQFPPGPTGKANGLALDPQGLVIACEGGNKRVTRTAANGTATSIASTFNATALNSPNDVIVRSDGTIYFTDPNYTANPDTQAFESVFRISPQGTLATVDTTLTRPNGIALSPDEKTLYVADEAASKVVKYTVNSDGTTSANAAFTNTSANPDGMAVDDAGNLYVSTAAGVEVYKPNAMKVGTITVPKQPANCTFGGADRRTLYITARTSLYQIRLNVPGLP